MCATHTTISYSLTGQSSKRKLHTQWIVDVSIGYHIFVLAADPSDYFFITNVDRTCGPTHLLVFSGNKIRLNYILPTIDKCCFFFSHPDFS